MNFFCNFETAPVNKVSLIFSSQNHTPLWLLSMLQWLILNCNQTLQVNFLAFYNNLVSQVRDLMRPWNLSKYISLTNKVYWWNHSHFLWKICFWSVIYTTTILHSQWHYWSSSLHKRYPWYKFSSHTISWGWDTSWWEVDIYLPTAYFPYPLYAYYSSKKVYVQIK